MQTLETERPSFPSASHSESLMKSSRLYDTPQQYETGDTPSPYNMDEKKQRSPRRINPHRKYTKQWWGTAWDISVEVGKWPRVAYFIFGLILVAIWIAVMIKFADEEVKQEKANLEGGSGKHRSERSSSGLYYKGILRKFDPDNRILTVQWTLATFDSDNTTLITMGSTENTSFPFNVYRDVKAVQEDRNSTVDPTFDPSQYLRIDNTSMVPIGVLGQHDWDSIDTDIDFTQSRANDAWKQPLFAYPFDEWSGSIVLATTDRLSADAVGLNNSIVVETLDAFLGDETLNWKISMDANNTCLVPDPFAGCELHINFTGSRPGLVIFAAIVAVIVNWTSTIGIFLLTGEAVVMRRYWILKETDILGVCLTALFALPSVRAILPGAPDFGAIIDLIGIIPNIIIISLCTTTFAVSKLLMKRPSKEDKDD